MFNNCKIMVDYNLLAQIILHRLTHVQNCSVEAIVEKHGVSVVVSLL